MHENCGVFGVYSPTNCNYYTKMGIHALNHRGEEYCGIATYNKNDLQLITRRGKVEPNFTEEILGKLERNLGIGHISAKDPQPFLVDSLHYNTLEDFVDAVVNCKGSKITRSDLCLTCFGELVLQ